MILNKLQCFRNFVKARTEISVIQVIPVPESECDEEVEPDLPELNILEPVSLERNSTVLDIVADLETEVFSCTADVAPCSQLTKARQITVRSKRRNKGPMFYVMLTVRGMQIDCFQLCLPLTTVRM